MPDNKQDLFDLLKEYNSSAKINDLQFLPNPHEFITVRGAREHNLKNVSLVIPKNKMVVFSGLSGSGKSSLVFDTIYAEGQRRYVESLSSYARQFLGLKEKPDVDSIDGLSPAISIDQKPKTNNPRSTVGTITEIYDYIRLLYAKIGRQHCPECGAEISTESVTQMVDRILKLPTQSPAIVLAPIVEGQKGWHRQHIVEAKKQNFRRLRIDGKVYLIDQAEKLDLNKQQKHNIEIVVDRIGLQAENKNRLLDSLEICLKLTSGKALVLYYDEEEEEKIFFLNKNRACPNGHGTTGDLEPRIFSFNSPHGACPNCTGLGVITEIDPSLIVPNESLSIMEGCIRPLSRMSISGGWLTKVFEKLAQKHKFDLHTPWKNLTKKQKDILLYGDGSKFEGVIVNLKRRYKESSSDSARRDIESYMNKRICPDCNGARLKKESLSVTVAGKNIASIVDLSIADCLKYFSNLRIATDLLNNKDREISNMILKEISSRLAFLVNVGLEYLTLARSADTLSGGEAQRIRLATQIGSGLTGVLYILDEPSIGLHQRDNEKLLKTLKNLRDLGNSVIVVEHDEDTIRTADFLVDIGPKAGKNGGLVVVTGTPEEVSQNSKSPTGRFLSRVDSIAIPKKRREVDLQSKEIDEKEEILQENKDYWIAEITRRLRSY